MRKKEKGEEKKILVRIANSDLDGEKNILYGLTGIKGISYTFSKAICHCANLDPFRKLSSLTEEEIKKIEDIIYNPLKYNIPPFLLNRRRDPETGKDYHLIGDDIDIKTKFDIQREISLKTWRGYRHMHGQPVRGQRTRSHFRKGATVGVIRKKK